MKQIINILHYIRNHKLLFSQLGIALFLIMLFGLFWQSNIFTNKEHEFLSPTELKWINEHPEIRWSIDPDYQPIEFYNEKGVPDGVTAEIMQIISKATGIRFINVKTETWSETVKSVIEKKADFTTAIEKNDYRDQFMNFTSPYYNVPYVIIVHQSIKDYFDLSDLDGKSLAIIEDWTMNRLIQKKYPNIKIHPVVNIEEALTKTSNGEVFATVMHLVNASYFLEEHEITNLRVAGETEFKSKLRFAVRNDWPEFTQILEKCLNNIEEEKIREIKLRWTRYAESKKSKEWLPTSLTLSVAGITLLILILFSLRNSIQFNLITPNHKRILSFSTIAVLLISLVLILYLKTPLLTNLMNANELTPEEKKWLQQNDGKIVLGAEREYSPIYFIDQHGQFKGLAADYARLMEEKLDFSFKIVEYESLDHLIKDTQEGNVDLIFGLQYNKKRSEFLEFTHPFISLKNVILVRQNDKRNLTESDLQGDNINIVANSTLHHYFENNYPQYNISPVLSPTDGFINVSFGSSDMMIDQLAVSSYIIEKEGISNLRVAGYTKNNLNLKVANRKGIPHLNSILTKALNLISDQEKEAIYNRWISFEDNMKSSKNNIIIILLTLSGLILILISVIVWNQSLKKEVQKKTEQLSENERQLSILTDNLPGIAYRCKKDKHWTMEYINETCYEITGYHSYELINNYSISFANLIHLKDRDRIEKTISEKVVEEKPFEEIYRIKTKNGKLKWLWEKGQAILDENKNVIALEGFITEITDRVVAENEIRKLNKKLEEKVEERSKQLKTANQELQEFAYIVSHDLKAPLRGINQLSHWFANDFSDRIDEDGQNQLRLMQSRVQKMDQLIDGILQYSRAGSSSTNNSEIDTNQLIKEIIDLLNPPSKTQISILNELPLLVGDKIKLQQVFQNLISNAIKYNDKERIIIKISCTEMDKQWKFEINDNGMGIEEKYIELIFGIFQTIDKKQDSNNTGVGLSIVKRIVESMHGKIWVESTPKQGSTFYFTLPK